MQTVYLWLASAPVLAQMHCSQDARQHFWCILACSVPQFSQSAFSQIKYIENRTSRWEIHWWNRVWQKQLLERDEAHLEFDAFYRNQQHEDRDQRLILNPPNGWIWAHSYISCLGFKSIRIMLNGSKHCKIYLVPAWEHASNSLHLHIALHFPRSSRWNPTHKSGDEGETSSWEMFHCKEIRNFCAHPARVVCPGSRHIRFKISDSDNHKRCFFGLQ